MIIRFTIEVMGKPPEMVDKTLRQVVKSFGERYKIVHEDYSEIKQIEKSSLFSGFVEIEFEVENFEKLFAAVIDYGPTIVEVVEPSEIKVRNIELQSALSDLVAKFHQFSKAIQYLKVENMKLKEKIPPGSN